MKDRKIYLILDIDGVLINENGSFTEARNKTLKHMNLYPLTNEYEKLLLRALDDIKLIPGFGNEQLATMIMINSLFDKKGAYPDWIRLESQTVEAIHNLIMGKHWKLKDYYENMHSGEIIPSFYEFCHIFEHAYFSKNHGCSWLKCNNELPFHEYWKMEQILLNKYFPISVEGYSIITSRTLKEAYLALEILHPIINSKPDYLITIDKPPCKPNNEALTKIFLSRENVQFVYIGDGIDDIELVRNHYSSSNFNNELKFIFISNKPNSHVNIGPGITSMSYSSINDFFSSE